MKKKRYTPEYKAKIVLEALREEATVSEIASREQINPNQIQNWKREAVGNFTKVFSSSKDARDSEKWQEMQRGQQERLEKKVGQLTLEVDFLKEACNKIYGSGWEETLGFK